MKLEGEWRGNKIVDAIGPCLIFMSERNKKCRIYFLLSKGQLYYKAEYL